MVEGGGLENRFPVFRNGGSNPSPSATFQRFLSRFPAPSAVFTIGPGTAPGVRGSLNLLKRLLAPPLFAQEPPENPGPEEAVLPDGWSSSGVSFYLWSDPSGAVGVRMFGGRARVEDPAAQKPVILNTGEFYRGPAVKRAKDVVVNLVGS